MFERIINLLHPSRVKNFYENNESHISLAALVLGFALDNVSLSRVDALLDQAALIVYVVVSGICIILLSAYESGKLVESVPGRMHFWLSFCMQFAFGGLFSALVVFYTRSATLESAWPFLLLLVVYFLGNEFFKSYYSRLSFRVSVFFFVLLSVSLLIVPTVMRQIGSRVFLISTITAICLFVLFMIVLRVISNAEVNKHILKIRAQVFTIVLLVAGLYYANMIPPLPLILKNSGVYHDLVLNGDKSFTVMEERSGFISNFFNSKKTFHRVGDEPVYVVTAVYSPSGLNTFVTHNWEYFNPVLNRWTTESNIKVPITGGRQNGYRLYSLKRVVRPGLWRVNVLAPENKLIGRVKFEILATTTELTNLKLKSI